MAHNKQYLSFMYVSGQAIGYYVITSPNDEEMVAISPINLQKILKGEIEGIRVLHEHPPIFAANDLLRLVYNQTTEDGLWHLFSYGWL